LGDIVDFAELLHLVNLVPGIDRIRYTTSHPMEFSEAIVACYAEIPALVDHLHLPVQTGSDRILMAMKRGHTALEYKAIIRALRKIRPNISLSSDFIIGFPGETEEDFAATMRLIEKWALIVRSVLSIALDLAHRRRSYPTTRLKKRRKSACTFYRHALRNKRNALRTTWWALDKKY
jgi:tRNA A37 methylthiotransferase MiaB